MKKKLIFTFCFLFSISTFSYSQTFTNGDLDGTIFGLATLPDFWDAVPFGDPVCLASNANAATPDLTDTAGPVVFLGIMGNPYAGLTFVSGEHGLSALGDTYHEGIQQVMDSLVPGQNYTIRFFQSVVKSSLVLDQSGSWAVYSDNDLIAVTDPTFSAEPFNSTSFIWELREINFTPFSTEHTIKFLPLDDDTVQLVGSSTTGALRMGIDSISIYSSFATNIVSAFDPVIAVYPNPVINSINLKLNNFYKDVTIDLFDLTGRKLYNKNYINARQISFSINQPPGSYLLKISADQFCSTKKVLIIKD